MKNRPNEVGQLQFQNFSKVETKFHKISSKRVKNSQRHEKQQISPVQQKTFFWLIFFSFFSGKKN